MTTEERIIASLQQSKGNLPRPKDDTEKELIVRLYRRFRYKSVWKKIFGMKDSEELLIEKYEEELGIK